MKSLGISDRLGAARFECVQNEYNLLQRSAEAEVLPLVTEERLSFVAYSPLGGGWLTGKYRMDQPPPPGSRMALRPGPYEGLKNRETYHTIEAFAAIAADFSTSMAALALAWAFSNPAVTAALAGPRNLKQFEPVAEAVEVKLTDADRQRIAT